MVGQSKFASQDGAIGLAFRKFLLWGNVLLGDQRTGVLFKNAYLFVELATRLYSYLILVQNGHVLWLLLAEMQVCKENYRDCIAEI